jgi:hypothetical protein
MGKESLQLALKMAENARAGIAKELKQEQVLRPQETTTLEERRAALSSR